MATLTGQLGARIDLLNSASDAKEEATGVFGKAAPDQDYGIEPAPRLRANATLMSRANHHNRSSAP